MSVVIAMGMTSCGGEDICSCTKAMGEMGEKMLAEDADQKAIEEEYKDQMDACKELGESMVEGLEGEELEAKQKEMAEEAEACE